MELKSFFYGLLVATCMIWIILFSGSFLYVQYVTQNIRQHSGHLVIPIGNICDTSVDNRKLYIRQHGKYWILYNYVLSRRYHQGNESITYTTTGEFSSLDKLEALVERWQAPISIALMACGSDFGKTLNSINYLRTCSTKAALIIDFVTFHLFFEEDHIPPFFPKTPEQILRPFDCSRTAPFQTLKEQPYLSTYRAEKKLSFPINLAHNIARLEAHTYFVFPLEIDLFPTINFVSKFLHFVEQIKLQNPKSVFVTPIYEMYEGHVLPKNKTELQQMIKNNLTFSYLHSKTTKLYYEIPDQEEWIAKEENATIEIFKIVKHEAIDWEPFYVTINQDEPLFDERFTSETEYDKNIQAHLLAMLNYDFILLDNTFLMHPGIENPKNPTQAESRLRWQMLLKGNFQYKEQLSKIYVQQNLKRSFG